FVGIDCELFLCDLGRCLRLSARRTNKQSLCLPHSYLIKLFRELFWIGCRIKCLQNEASGCLMMAVAARCIVIGDYCIWAQSSNLKHHSTQRFLFTPRS